MADDSIDDIETDEIEENEFGFFAALLMRFPEIASVRTSIDDSVITITFLLSTSPDQELVEAFCRRLNASLAALTRVIGDGSERIAQASVTSFEASERNLASLIRKGAPTDGSLESSSGHGGDLNIPGTVIASLEVILPLHSVVAEEFAILRGMVLESFGEVVIVESEGSERKAPEWEFEPSAVDEAYPLEYTLRRFKASGAKGHIYGFRDGARVFVYRA